MSAYDILLYSTVDEGAARRAVRTNITAATFMIGEPVVIVANELANGETGPGGVDPVDIFGVAAESAVSGSNMMAALEIEDTLRTVELPNEDKLFLARYFAEDGAGTLATPTYAGVAGVPANLVHNGTQWTFDTGAANLNCEGVDVVDSNGTRLGDDLTFSGAGAMVLFRFV
jgi:hypothetical protein